MTSISGKEGQPKRAVSVQDARKEHVVPPKSYRDKASAIETTANLRYWILNQNMEGIPESAELNTKKTIKHKRKPNVLIDIPRDQEEYFHEYSSGARGRSVLPVATKHSNILNVSTDIQSVADTGVWITNKKQYDEELNIQQRYKKRIAELEGVIETMCNDYDVMYKETVALYEKLNSSDRVPESYNRVLADRQILRDAEEAYKRRTSAVQNKTRTIQDTNKKLELEIRQLKNKIPRLEDQFKKETQYNKLHWEKKALLSESETLKKQVKLLRNELTTNVRLGYWDMSSNNYADVAEERNTVVKYMTAPGDYDVEPGSAIVQELEGQLQHLSVIKRHQLAEIHNLRHNIESAKKEQDAWNAEKRKYDIEIKHLKIRLAEAKKLHLSESNKTVVFTY